jgi:hypothetical protein
MEASRIGRYALPHAFPRREIAFQQNLQFRDLGAQ